MENSHPLSSFSASLVASDDNAKDKVVDSIRRPPFTIGVFPGTFRTFIDLSSEDDEDTYSKVWPSQTKCSEEDKDLRGVPDLISKFRAGEGEDAEHGDDKDGKDGGGSPEVMSTDDDQTVTLQSTIMEEVAELDEESEVSSEVGQHPENLTVEAQFTDSNPSTVTVGAAVPCFDKSLSHLGDEHGTDSNSSLVLHSSQSSHCASCTLSTLSTGLDPLWKKPPQNKLACEERKSIIVFSNRPLKVTQAMKQW